MSKVDTIVDIFARHIPTRTSIQMYMSVVAHKYPSSNTSFITLIVHIKPMYFTYNLDVCLLVLRYKTVSTMGELYCTLLYWNVLEAYHITDLL